MCHEAVCLLDCNVRAVRSGRAFIIYHMTKWGRPDEAYVGLDSLLLVASEMISNALRFCQGSIALTLRVHRDEVYVAVTDSSPALAVVRHPGPYAEGGRGMALVEALSSRWGQDWNGDHKSVWCTLPVPSGSALVGGCAG